MKTLICTIVAIIVTAIISIPAVIWLMRMERKDTLEYANKWRQYQTI